MSDQENTYYHDELLAKWLAGELSSAELDELRQREDFAELEELVGHLSRLSPPDFDEEKSWQSLQKKLATHLVAEGEEKAHPSSTPPTQVYPVDKMRSMKRYVPAIAAVLLIGVLVWLLLGRDDFSVTTQIATGPGEKKELTLPDGSKVVLNASSTLGYSPKNWKERRYVVLSGEALFNAKKGRRFTVHTKLGDVVIVGTQFNVYARNNELEVKCLQGKVQVINPAGTERVLLKQREQVSVINGRMQKRRGLVFYPTWQKGESSFRNAPLEKVLTELQAQYGLVIVADSLGQRSFSGKFVHGDLEKAVKMVCQPLQLHCTISEDTLRIKN